ncbi:MULTISPECIES: hypothetical protein [unclassified Synechococcus]|uniref:hypothetical protein n=1 Tax=unclassified Synechococcus TaxID=2626047 RepID=UPI001626C283|nr:MULTISPECIES: hypothetical protein [unclassified Synechococcus]
MDHSLEVHLNSYARLQTLDLAKAFGEDVRAVAPALAHLHLPMINPAGMKLRNAGLQCSVG